jgi:3',5'-cyclic AMP phosphodiesterase CpdA
MPRKVWNIAKVKEYAMHTIFLAFFPVFTGAAGNELLIKETNQPPDATGPLAQRPLFTFVQLNDTHILAAGKGYWLANEKARDVIEIINREARFPLPDFVILPGDIIHGGSKDKLLPDCEFAKKLLAPLRCCWYPIIGNHEVVQQEGDPAFQEAYEKIFGAGHVNYHFLHKGILFICLNNSGGRGGGDAVADKRNAWLKDVLERNPKIPKIIACHIPLIPLREEEVLKKSFGFSSYKALGDGTWNIVKAHSNTVIAVLCGHLHLSGAVEKDGIWNISVSGTASYPCDFARYVVYGDRIEVEIQQISKDMVTSNSIHGPPRWPQVFTDGLHQTADEYVCGRSAERRFTISLPAEVVRESTRHATSGAKVDTSTIVLKVPMKK